MTLTVFGYPVLISIEFDDQLLRLLYQTLKTVFQRLSKHQEFRHKYSAARRVFNSLLGVWIAR